jgi:hypothetical protein
MASFPDYKQIARQQRAIYLRKLGRNGAARLASATKSRVSLSAVAIVVVAAGLWALPPQPVASSALNDLDVDTTAALASEQPDAAAQPTCTGGNEVSRFVCRNTWMGQHSLSYR